MKKNKRSDIDDFFEWTTLSYRTLKIWGTVLVLIILIAGWWGVNKYISESSRENKRKTEKLEKRAAKFISVEGKVMVKPLSSTEWLPASQVKEIYPGDLIRTEADGRCKILFFNGTEYEVKPNSLISVLESYEDISTSKKIVGVELTNGELNLTTSNEPVRKSKTKVETSNIVAKIEANTTASAKYDLKNKKTSFRVNKGIAEVKSKITNKSLKIFGHQGVEASNTEMKTFSYPGAPDLISPDNEQLFLTNRPEKLKINFEWRGDDKTERYIFYISRTKDFSNGFKKKMGKEKLVVKGFSFGTYYWMVKPIGKNGIEGENSSVYMFAVKPKKVNPPSSIKIKYKIIIEGNIVRIAGTTAPDNKLKINGNDVILNNDGTFEHLITLKDGQRVLNLLMEITDYTGSKRVIKKEIKIF